MSEALPDDLIRRFLVEDVMATPAFTARPRESLLAAAKTMRAHHVSGLPVVDEKRRVIGVLSEKDIVGALDRRGGVARPRGILDLLLATYEPKEHDAVHRATGALLSVSVAETMSKPAATVEADAPLGEAWHLLRQYGINRLPVCKAGRLIGMLTREDVLGVLDMGNRRTAKKRRRYARSPPPGTT